MKENVKIRRVTVNPVDYINKMVGKELIKDLKDGEDICDVCEGTGIVLGDSKYGFKEDVNKYGNELPYSNQTLSLCSNCFNGVVKICEYCGEKINKLNQHRCDGIKNKERQEINKRELTLLDRAIKLKYDDPTAKQMEMMYSEHYNPNEGFFSSWDEFFDSYVDVCLSFGMSKEEADRNKPKYVWGTSKIEMEIGEDSELEGVYQDTRYAVEIPWELEDTEFSRWK